MDTSPVISFVMMQAIARADLAQRPSPASGVCDERPGALVVGRPQAFGDVALAVRIEHYKPHEVAVLRADLEYVVDAGADGLLERAVAVLARSARR